ncbi:hypothetical protein JCM15519_07390 [Fundidesulfovibrio butyratiphilus]
MVIDFNDCEQQRDVVGAIPPDSIVLVRLNLRQPKKPGSHPLICRADSGFEYLDGELEVLAGTYTGRKVWENFGVGAQTEGGMKAVKIAGQKLRAIVEASRNILPDDQSPTAMQGRRLNDWAELNGVMFGIVVGCAKPRAGDQYVNNQIKKIVTPDHEVYSSVMNGGEFISDKPLPEIPQVTGGAAPSWTAPINHQKPAPSAAPTAWGAPPATSQQPAQQAQPQQSVAAPNWAQPAQGQPAGQQPHSYGAAQGQAPATGQHVFPSEASGMDDVPF